MAKWKLVVGVLLVFSAGMLVGSFATGYGLRYFFDRFKHDSQYRIDFLLGRLTRRLDLSKAQQEKINTILIQADKEINQYWLTVLSEVEKKVDLAKTEIKMELDSGQRKKFEKYSNSIRDQQERESTFMFGPHPAN